jgi:multidrug efflux system membrane fusion protein
MRLVSPVIAILIVLGLGWWFVLRHEPTPTVATSVTPPPGDAAQTAVEPVPVMVLEIETTETAEEKTLRGRTQANRAVEVRAETEGLVVSEPMRAGARVETGTVLCQLAKGSREARLAEAHAALAEAQAEADAAETLSAKGFTAETTRIAREARLEAAEAALELVKLDIERTTMRAPFDGVLETDSAELGSRLGVGALCATLIDLSQIKVIAYVSELDIDRLHEGDRVRVRLVNGLTREGEIRFVGRMADEETRTYRVEAVLANEDGRIRDGMTAEIMVELPPESAHRIPQMALTLDDRGRLGVRLAEDGVARFRPVRVLRDEPGGVWVTGLPDRARLIVVGQEFVRDGRPVEAVVVSPDELG